MHILTARWLPGMSGPIDSGMSQLYQAMLPAQCSKPSRLPSCCAARKFSLQKGRGAAVPAGELDQVQMPDASLHALCVVFS